MTIEEHDDIYLIEYKTLKQIADILREKLSLTNEFMMPQGFIQAIEALDKMKISFSSRAIPQKLTLQFGEVISIFSCSKMEHNTLIAIPTEQLEYFISLLSNIPLKVTLKAETFMGKKVLGISKLLLPNSFIKNNLKAEIFTGEKVVGFSKLVTPLSKGAFISKPFNPEITQGLTKIAPLTFQNSLIQVI